MDKIRRAIEMHRGSFPSQSLDTARSKESDRETNELAEVDIYLAYRQYNRAKALLNEAIDREPRRSDLKLKLLNILFVINDADAYLDLFEKAAEDALDREYPEGWMNAVKMGAKLAPDNPLFACTIDSMATDDEDRDNATSKINTVSATLALVATVPGKSKVSKLELAEARPENSEGEALIAVSEPEDDNSSTATDNLDLQLATLLAQSATESKQPDAGQDAETPAAPRVRQLQVAKTAVDKPPELKTLFTPSARNTHHGFQNNFVKYGLAGAFLFAAALITVLWLPGTLRPQEDKKAAETQNTILPATVAPGKAAEPGINTVAAEPARSVKAAPNSTGSQTPATAKNEVEPAGQATNNGHTSLLAVASDNTIATSEIPATTLAVPELSSPLLYPATASQQRMQTDDNPRPLPKDVKPTEAQSGVEELSELEDRSEISQVSLSEPPAIPATLVTNQDNLQAEISRLLTAAETYRQRQLLTTPEGNNAWKTYQQVLKLDQDNAAANRGILQLADDYRTLAIRSLQNDKAEQSREFIERGLTLVPTHQGLLAMRDRITEQFLVEATNTEADGASMTELMVRIQELQQQLDQLATNRESGTQGELQDEYLAQLNSQVQQFLDEEKHREALRLVQNGLQVMPTHPQLNAQEKAIKQIIANRTEGAKEAARYVNGLTAQAAEHRKNGELQKSLALVEVGLRLMHNHRPLLDLQEELMQEIQESQ